MKRADIFLNSKKKYCVCRQILSFFDVAKFLTTTMSEDSGWGNVWLLGEKVGLLSE